MQPKNVTLLHQITDIDFYSMQSGSAKWHTWFHVEAYIYQQFF
jgi:hypothetical protein